MPPSETLICKQCGKQWTRTRARGIKPTRCTVCKPPKDVSHSKPRKEIKNSGKGITPGINPVPVSDRTEALSTIPIPTSKVSDAMLEILTGEDFLEPEWARKADYVVGQLNDPKIFMNRPDIDLLLEVQADLVRQHNMRLRLTAQARYDTMKELSK